MASKEFYENEMSMEWIFNQYLMLGGPLLSIRPAHNHCVHGIFVSTTSHNCYQEDFGVVSIDEGS